MSFTKIMKSVWKKPEKSIPEYKEKIRKWRKQKAVARIPRPTNLVRARALGYKAKKGYIIVQARIRKGGRKRPKPKKGRKPKRMGISHFTPGKKRQSIIEQRTAKKYPNMEVLNSYKIGSDGQYHYFEIILVNPKMKTTKATKLGKGTGRAHRGKTSAARKSRMKLHRK